MVSMNWQADIFHHLDNKLLFQSPTKNKKKLVKKKEKLNKRSYLSFYALSTTRETEFMMTNRWTLNKMCIFKSFLANCTFQRWIWSRCSWCWGNWCWYSTIWYCWSTNTCNSTICIGLSFCWRYSCTWNMSWTRWSSSTRRTCFKFFKTNKKI